MKRKSSLIRFLIVSLSLLLLLSIVIAKTLYDAGELGAVFDHPLPSCFVHENVTGPEDLTTVDDGRTVLISAVDRQDIASVKMIPGIYHYTEGSSPRLLKAIDGQPHGISAVPTELGSRVYVVVHQKNTSDRVEIYDWLPAAGTLTLSKTISFPNSGPLNGITALSDDRFFVTQDFAYFPGLRQEVEKILRLPLGKIWYYDGKSEGPRVVREDILYPNGIATSPDLKQLYVASMTGRSLITYDMNLSPDGEVALKWRREWPLSTAPDNLKWAEDKLLVGSHRQLVKTLLHSIDAKRYRAPSQLIQIEGLPDKMIIRELHSTKAGGVEAISTGVLSKVSNRIIMGGIWTSGVLDCDGREAFPLPDSASHEPTTQSTP